MKKKKTSKPTIIILGITGDLSKKKLIPAIYKLISDKKLKDFNLVGIGRRDIAEKEILENSQEYIKYKNNNYWKILENNFNYFKADLSNYNSICELKRFVIKHEKEKILDGERIFYMATSPDLFVPITKKLHKCKLGNKKSKFVFEKPFGNDSGSAIEINKEIKKLFTEKQIYRIDHYLGKEIIQNLVVARFNNEILEPLWNNKYIDHVQIILTEDFGIHDRGAFYDKYGAIKDVMQNHMLQILSLFAMEQPQTIKGEYIRERKVEVLKSIKNIDKTNISLGQYNGYKSHDKINKDSKTETFAAVKLFVKNKRWKNVPFYLLTGKNMRKKSALVYIEFKQTNCQMLDEGCSHDPNFLVIEIQPNEGFYFQINAKPPRSDKLKPVKMEFCHSCEFGINSPEAYENLFVDILNNNQTTFIRSDEIEEQWRIVDSMNSKNSKNKKDAVEKYDIGKIPNNAKKLIEKDGRKWRLDL